MSCFQNFQPVRNDNWENRWAPYDPPTYRAALEQLQPEDIALDIGAGDLRLARQMAQVVRKVYGVELNIKILNQGMSQPLPDNLIVFRGDARTMDFPPDVTTGVLLMRHCAHFRLYVEKLKKIGCKKLITNARWRMGVEVVNLWSKRVKFEQINIGWYACWCGAVGFKCGPVELLTPENESLIYETADCPGCAPQSQT